MKRVAVLLLVGVALAGFSGCGKKSRENAMSEALEQAASTTETGEQGNFLIYEGEANNPSSAVPAQPYAAGEGDPVVATGAEQPAPMAAAGEKPTNEQIQQALKGAGLYDGPIDGKIGPKSKKAIRKFQIQNDLTVDGKVGRKTWTKMQPFLTSAAPAAMVPEATTMAPVTAEAAY